MFYKTKSALLERAVMKGHTTPPLHVNQNKTVKIGVVAVIRETQNCVQNMHK